MKSKSAITIDADKQADIAVRPPPEFVALGMANREYDTTVVKLSVPRIEDKNSSYVDQLVNMELAISINPEDVATADIRSALFSEMTVGRTKQTKATYGDKVSISPPQPIEGWRVELHDPDAEEEWEELKGKKLLLIGFIPRTAAVGDVLLRVTGLGHHYGGRLMYPYEFKARFIEHEGSGQEEDDRQTTIDQFVNDEEEQV